MDDFPSKGTIVEKFDYPSETYDIEIMSDAGMTEILLFGTTKSDSTGLIDGFVEASSATRGRLNSEHCDRRPPQSGDAFESTQTLRCYRKELVTAALSSRPVVLARATAQPRLAARARQDRSRRRSIRLAAPSVRAPFSRARVKRRSNRRR
jgi:hypothetical protein